MSVVSSAVGHRTQEDLSTMRIPQMELATILRIRISFLSSVSMHLSR